MTQLSALQVVVAVSAGLAVGGVAVAFGLSLWALALLGGFTSAVVAVVLLY